MEEAALDGMVRARRADRHEGGTTSTSRAALAWTMMPVSSALRFRAEGFTRRAPLHRAQLSRSNDDVDHHSGARVPHGRGSRVSVAPRGARRGVGGRRARARDEDDTARHLRDGTARATASAAAPRARADRAKPLTVVSGYGGVYGRGPERGGIIRRPRPRRRLPPVPGAPPGWPALLGFFFAQFPQAIFLLQPLQPLASMYFRIPFAGMISFFAIYMGIAENRTLSRFVRFNGMQAIIGAPSYLGQIEYVLSPGRLSGVAFDMYRMCYNCVWLFVLVAFCLAAVGCLSGQMYKLPFIGDAAVRV